MPAAFLVAACSLNSSACSGDEDPTHVGCHPLAPAGECLLPFPSDHFLVEDRALPSGRRFVLPPEARLQPDDGSAPFDVTSVHTNDGFSHLSQILALFPTGIDASDLIFHTDDVNRSLSASSKTLLIRADTGEPVLHFAEMDPRTTDDTRRALLIRPLERLANETRYIVAIHGLRDPHGAPLQPPAAFAQLRAGARSGTDPLASMSRRYEQGIFPVLERFGVERDALQLAWDFTTQSERHVTADLLHIRADLHSRLQSNPPRVVVTRVLNDINDAIARQIEGTIEVPLYMNDALAAASLLRGDDGRPMARGRAQVPFTLLIPQTVMERSPDAPPARLLQYGHGFFGRRTEVLQRAEFFNTYGCVALALDAWGMTFEDSVMAIQAILADPSETLGFVDRVNQGMANHLAAVIAARGEMAELEAIQIGGRPAYDRNQIYYLGISQGAILGGTYVALSPHIDRAVLNVGGAGFSFMMFRSLSFSRFLSFLEMTTGDPLDIQKLAALTQMSFDRIDPLTYAPRLLGSWQAPYSPGPTSRQILMQIGLDDAQVPNLASHIYARSLGLPLLAPASTQVPGLSKVQHPYDGSAMAVYDFGLDSPPANLAIPPTEDNMVHEAVRRLDPAQKQMNAFLQPGGTARSFCVNACKPD